ncbi:MAG: hypothetical protein PHF97_05665 [Bacteroidales bacterium]|nr:hypothetical protein [Bacteroidales bacterium]MDD4603274.1 hypothetical protein [Bacteroidales bacterium]
MKNLFFVSLLGFLLMAGCVSIKPKNLTRSTSGDISHIDVPANLLGNFNKALYTATLDIKKHHLSGLMLIKKMDSVPEVYRLVFANEFGMTYFDLEMKPDSFKVISCFEPLYNKALIKILETDYRLLLSCYPKITSTTYQQEKSRQIIISGDAGKIKFWKTYSATRDTLLSIAGKSNFADAAKINLSSYSKGFPTKIIILNQFIGMQQSLQLLSK